jgi:hypothetical protein
MREAELQVCACPIELVLGLLLESYGVRWLLACRVLLIIFNSTVKVPQILARVIVARW